LERYLARVAFLVQGVHLQEKTKRYKRTLPLMKNIATLREMCKEGRNLITLNKICAFRNHLQFLIQKPNNEWSEESMNIYIYSVTKTEFEKILNSTKQGHSQNLPMDLSIPKNELQSKSSE
jgi:hypothetical protein